MVCGQRFKSGVGQSLANPPLIVDPGAKVCGYADCEAGVGATLCLLEGTATLNPAKGGIDLCPQCRTAITIRT